MGEVHAVIVEEVTLSEAAVICGVKVEWLVSRMEGGYFPGARMDAFPAGSLLRARRMHEMERDFDASVELAALVADLLEELDALKNK